MKFLDSNIFIYAFYRPGHHLTELDKKMKDLSKRVITEVSGGRESVVTTVVHLYEVANILKHSLTIRQLGEMIGGIFSLDNVEVLGVDKDEYLAANELGMEMDMDPNDALAFQAMQSKNVEEIYSFDRVFDRVEGIRRVPVL